MLIHAPAPTAAGERQDHMAEQATEPPLPSTGSPCGAPSSIPLPQRSCSLNMPMSTARSVRSSSQSAAAVRERQATAPTPEAIRPTEQAGEWVDPWEVGKKALRDLRRVPKQSERK